MNDSDRERLRQQQSALAKALTDTAKRDGALHDDPTLVGLDPNELSRAAETLIRKRLSQTSSMLPLSARVLGPEFAPLFRTFAASHFFYGDKAIWRDAIEFANWVAKRRSHPVWLHDCLAWESKQCRWESSRYYLATLRLRYAVQQVLERDRDVAPDLQPRRVLFWRFRNHGVIRIHLGASAESMGRNV